MNLDESPSYWANGQREASVNYLRRKESETFNTIFFFIFLIIFLFIMTWFVFIPESVEDQNGPGLSEYLGGGI